MPTISEKKLRQIGIALLHGAGVSETEAQQTIALLIESNLVGHDSHGVIRIPTYIRQILSGQTQLESPVEVVKETPTTALVNGGWGLGQVVATKTMALAIKKAETHNIGVVSTFNCQHIGRMADYVAMAAAQDMVGYCCVNSTPGVAPFGGIQRMFNQSPLGWGIPAAKNPLSFSTFQHPCVPEEKLQLLGRGEKCFHSVVILIKRAIHPSTRRIIIAEEQVCR